MRQFSEFPLQKFLETVYTRRLANSLLKDPTMGLNLRSCQYNYHTTLNGLLWGNQVPKRLVT